MLSKSSSDHVREILEEAEHVRADLARAVAYGPSHFEGLLDRLAALVREQQAEIERLTTLTDGQRDSLREHMAMVRELTDPPEDYTFNTGYLVHWYRLPPKGGQTAGSMRPACRMRLPGPNPIVSEIGRVTCSACLRIIEATTWRPIETAPRYSTPIIVYWWDEHGSIEGDVVRWDGTDEIVPWQSLSDPEMKRADDYFQGWLPLPEVPR